MTNFIFKGLIRNSATEKNDSLDFYQYFENGPVK